MYDLLTVAVDAGRRARIAHTTRADGDLSPSTVAPELLARRRADITADVPWYTLRQVHGSRVVEVTDVAATDRPEADAAFTRLTGHALAVHTGDCVPVGFVHPSGVVAVAHAGWKGLEAGVLSETVRGVAVAAGDERPIVAAVGPHIRPAAYEFGTEDLDRLAARFGDHARATTSDDRPALDLTALTVHELARLGVDVVAVSPDCTAANPVDYYSHRARSDAGRIALVAWLEQP